MDRLSRRNFSSHRKLLPRKGEKKKKQKGEVVRGKSHTVQIHRVTKTSWAQVETNEVFNLVIVY